MILVGQEKRLAAPVNATRRERRAIGAFAVVLVAACLAAALVYLNRGSAGGRCVTVTLASYTGGVTTRQCGARAAAWCREAYQASPADTLARAVREQCRRTGHQPPSR